jgi:hypothetical protein
MADAMGVLQAHFIDMQCRHRAGTLTCVGLAGATTDSVKRSDCRIFWAFLAVSGFAQLFLGLLGSF